LEGSGAVPVSDVEIRSQVLRHARPAALAVALTPFGGHGVMRIVGVPRLIRSIAV
jgi:hypothetical protein